MTGHRVIHSYHHHLFSPLTVARSFYLSSGSHSAIHQIQQRIPLHSITVYCFLLDQRGPPQTHQPTCLNQVTHSIWAHETLIVSSSFLSFLTSCVFLPLPTSIYASSNHHFRPSRLALSLPFVFSIRFSTYLYDCF